MVREFKSSDRNKTVVSADGDEIGTIERVSGNKAYVKPKQGLTDSIRDSLGWTDEQEDTYELMHSEVQQFSGDEVHLKN